MVETAARELAMDPAEIRRKNFIQPDDFPYATPVALTYDTGDYEASLDKALQLIDYGVSPPGAPRPEANGKKRGIGFSSYIEACGLAPSQVAISLGAGVGLFESAEVRVNVTGSVTVFTGSHSHGQGHETTFAQVVSTASAFRSTKWKWCTATLRARTTASARTALAPSQWADPRWSGRPKRSLPRARRSSRTTSRRPRTVSTSLTVYSLSASRTGRWLSPRWLSLPTCPSTFRWTSWSRSVGEGFLRPGQLYLSRRDAHLRGGKSMARRASRRSWAFVAVDDFGNVINPMIVEGQVHGGLCQGIGQALLEHGVYDDAGQLVTGSYMDYCMPRADDMPSFTVDTTVTPCTHNPLGVKGCGEAGAIGATAAVMNAITDALGVKSLPMPATPETVWKALRSAA